MFMMLENVDLARLVRIASRVAATVLVPGTIRTTYDFDSNHYLVVDRSAGSWLLVKKANKKIVDLGTFDKKTGEMTSSKNETSPFYAPLEALLKEVK
jgi:hypothetical protein